MSLKVFHVVFISLSVVLAFGFGLWLLVGQPVEGGLIDIVAALLSFGVGILLVLYEIRIVKKCRSTVDKDGGNEMKRLEKLTLTRLPIILLAFFLMTGPAWACPVCYGSTDPSTIAGVNLAILALLGVTGSVLAGFGSFFLHIRKRSRMALRGSNDVPKRD
jgi:hypothetical protein